MPVTGGMRHYKSSLLQKTERKSALQPTTSKLQLVRDMPALKVHLLDWMVDKLLDAGMGLSLGHNTTLVNVPEKKKKVYRQ